MSVALGGRLSPNSSSIMEFRNELDVRIAEKMLRFPSLGQNIEGKWRLEFTNEMHMTSDSGIFEQREGHHRLPLYEGKMIHQFSNTFGKPRYWITESKGRKALLGRTPDTGQTVSYQTYRLCFRDVAAATNERTLISTVLPPSCFSGNTLYVSKPVDKSVLLFSAGLLNSFVSDHLIRMKVSNHCNAFYIYELPIPRLSPTDVVFATIAQRSAKLICTSPDFDELARVVGLRDHRDSVTDPTERARLRAELDGMIAHVYGLTEEEFAYVLTTFPLVDQSVKDAALDAYREFAPKPGDQEIAALIAKGESNTLEFKATARWDIVQNKPNRAMEDIVVKTTAAFLNTDGGTLLIGVADDRTVLGLELDYKTFSKKDPRDAYENFLTTLLLGNFGKDTAALISIGIHELNGNDVAKVSVKPSPKPVFVKEDKYEHLYLRAGNSTRLLSTREAIEYCKMHWPT